MVRVNGAGRLVRSCRRTWRLAVFCLCGCARVGWDDFALEEDVRQVGFMALSRQTVDDGVIARVNAIVLTN